LILFSTGDPRKKNTAQPVRRVWTVCSPAFILAKTGAKSKRERSEATGGRVI